MKELFVCLFLQSARDTDALMMGLIRKGYCVESGFVSKSLPVDDGVHSCVPLLLAVGRAGISKDNLLQDVDAVISSSRIKFFGFVIVPPTDECAVRSTNILTRDGGMVKRDLHLVKT